jgi:hypothetical protein
MPDCAIDWSTATVENGTLGVQLTGAPDEVWRQSFDSVLQPLQQGARGVWGHISLVSDEIRVNDVEDGSVTALASFLETVVHQANLDVDQKAAVRKGVDERHQADVQDKAEADRQMTEKFRNMAAKR